MPLASSSFFLISDSNDRTQLVGVFVSVCSCDTLAVPVDICPLARSLIARIFRHVCCAVNPSVFSSFSTSYHHHPL